MIRLIVISCLAAGLIASLAGVLHSTNVARGTLAAKPDEPIVLYRSNDAGISSTRKVVTKHVRQSPSSSPSRPAVDKKKAASRHPSEPRHDEERSSVPEPSLKHQQPRLYERNAFTFSSFPVAGINLADFGITENSQQQQQQDSTSDAPFRLFSDFDLTSQIVGNETWTDLLRHRRDATFPSLSFYVDKIARKRWLPSVQVDSPKQFLLLYASELAKTLRPSNSTSPTSPPIKVKQAQKAIAKYLPTGIDYAAKPSHLSCAGGVWLTKIVGNMTYVGHGKKKLEPAGDNFSLEVVAKDLAEQLPKVQEYCGSRVKESLALVNVQPGIMAEERFTSPFEFEDETGGIEFKVFTIWGHMWLAVWRPGMDGAQAFLHRNGSNLVWRGGNELLPDWIDWQHIVDIAEKLGAHKDMFRTDIFVGVPANSPVLKAGTSREQRLKAVRYVVSENEIHPTEYFHVSGTKEILEEGARLWLAGYRIGNYQVVPNDEVPVEFVSLGMLPSNVTVSAFDVAGVDLAQYRGDSENDKSNTASTPPFELFEDFDLSPKLVGNETWVDLLEYRRNAEFPGLSFYVDKVARRRWMDSKGLDSPKAFLNKYATELPTQDTTNEILNLLPTQSDYVAKPTHLSCAGGVWLTKSVGNSTYVGNGKKPMKEDVEFTTLNIANDLAHNLQKVMTTCGSRPESIALQNVKPGILVEERFSSLEGLDDRGAMEFKVHTIWGRAWLVYWRAGVDGVNGFFNRDGSHLLWEGKTQPLPDWVDWNKIIRIGESLGAHKDMFRTDIFVGVPSGSLATGGSVAIKNQPSAVRYVVSETEIHPTPIRGTERVFDEGGRLWLAGYKIGNYKVAANTEVPAEFLKSGMVAESK